MRTRQSGARFGEGVWQDMSRCLSAGVAAIDPCVAAYCGITAVVLRSALAEGNARCGLRQTAESLRQRCICRQQPVEVEP